MMRRLVINDFGSLLGVFHLFSFLSISIFMLFFLLLSWACNGY